MCAHHDALLHNAELHPYRGYGRVLEIVYHFRELPTQVRVLLLFFRGV